jgi:hypothetical protein
MNVYLEIKLFLPFVSPLLYPMLVIICSRLLLTYHVGTTTNLNSVRRNPVSLECVHLVLCSLRSTRELLVHGRPLHLYERSLTSPKRICKEDCPQWMGFNALSTLSYSSSLQHLFTAQATTFPFGLDLN